MNESTNPQMPDDDELAEQLVAYLDNELPADAARRVEERLATDARAQHEMQLLDRVWQALDSLPAAQLDDRFTRTTVEMVALKAQEEQRARQRRAPWHRFGAWMAGALLLLGCAGLGYVSVASGQGQENEQLLADLLVLENLDAYRQVGDIEFVKLLARLPADAFAPTDDDTETSAEARIEPPLPAPPSLDERAKRVASMSTADKQALLRRFERFSALDPAWQERLRRLQADLEKEPNRQELAAAIARYYAWVQTLSSFDRAELRELPAEKRFEMVERRLAASHDRQRDRTRAAGHRPSRETIAALSAWYREDILPEWQNRVLASLPPARREELEKMEGRQRERVLWGEGWRQLRERGMREPTFTEEQLARLAARLDPAGKERLAAAATHDDKVDMVRGWLAEMRDQYRPRGGPRGRGPDPWERELQRFFTEELSPAERKELEGLPRDQLRRRLAELYAEYRLLRGEDKGEGRP